MKNGNFRRSQPSSENQESSKKQYFSIFKWVPRPIKRFWRRYNVTRIFLVTITVILIFITGYLYFLSKAANVGVLQQSLSSQTQIMDKNGELAGTIYGQKGTQVTLDQVSPYVKEALIATEDRTFYKNNGINFERTIFATLTLGHFGGGSTITQQLAKNAYLTQAQTIDRKARELFLALQITKHYTKNQILLMYLNSSYFGNGMWGIEDASKRYYGVSASQLTADEAASLVGILKWPEVYNPLYSINYATSRRNTVLQNMVNTKVLSQADADKYMKVNIKSELKNTYIPQSANYKYPSYYNAVISEAKSKYHLTLQQIMNNGYKIYTGLDQNMQSGMQNTYNDTNLFPLASDGTMIQGASVALDPKTGAVEALVGNSPVENYDSFSGFNYATQAGRSPGSCIKPLIVYGPAVSAGWSIDKIVHDEATDYNGWKPQNADGQFHGNMPMYQALANSYNIPAINTYKEIGPAKGNALGKEFGITVNSTGLSSALGAGIETNPWQMAQAYSAFANNGLMNSAHLITKIENAAGQTIASAKITKKQVISADTASKMTQMMLGTYSNGTGAWADPKSYELAGKTGTNEDIDQWVIGYTPDIVITEWLGFSNPSNPEYRLDGTSEGMASVIFRQEASYILPYTQGTTFSEQNPYTQHGLPPIYPAYTYQRQLQDNIVVQEQAQNNTTGNISSSSSAQPSSKNNPLSDIGKVAKAFWDKITNFFK